MEKLTCAQNTLRFHSKSQLDPDLHNSGVSARFGARADIRVLAQSLSALVQRHESFWMRFYESDGLILRDIVPAPAVPLTVVHAEDWTPDEVQEDIVAQTVVPFDLGRGPALRASLHILSTGYALTLHFPHIVGDLIRPELLLDDLCAIYGHICQPDGTEMLPALPEDGHAGHVAGTERLVDNPIG